MSFEVKKALDFSGLVWFKVLKQGLLFMVICAIIFSLIKAWILPANNKQNVIYRFEKGSQIERLQITSDQKQETRGRFERFVGVFGSTDPDRTEVRVGFFAGVKF